jgi:chromosome segregation ATPase
VVRQLAEVNEAAQVVQAAQFSYDATKVKCPHCKKSLATKEQEAKLKTNLAKAKKAHEALLDAYAKWQERAKADAIELAKWQELDDALSAASAQHEALGKVMAAAEALTGLRTQLSATRESYKQAKANHDQLVAMCDKAEQAFKLLLTERAMAKHRQEANAEKARASAEAGVCRVAASMVTALQGELVAKAIGPLLAAANKLCEGILKSPLAYKDGELGMNCHVPCPTLGKGMVQPHFVPVASFSGTEKALAHCAVSLALASRSELRIAVLDEVTRLDEGNVGKLIGRLCDLEKEGAIDQAIVVDHRHPAKWFSRPPKNLTIIEV